MPIIDAMLMIEPPLPSASMRLPTSWAQAKAPSRLTDMVAANASAGTRSGIMPASIEAPALFTRMSTRPKRASAASTMAATSLLFVTSHRTTSVLLAESPRLAWTALSLSSLRAASTTFAPAVASASAKVTPRP